MTGRLAAVLAAVVCAGCGGGAEPMRGPPAPLRVTVSAGGLVPEVATGFAVGGGRVLTVAHVLAGGGAVRVAGRPARVVRADRRLDLAVLAVRGLRARTARFGAGGGTALVEVLRGGRPRALAARVRRRVTATVKGADGAVARPALELAAAIRPGDSGAPVTDGDGRIVGVVFARSDSAAWAVDASSLDLDLRSTSSRPSRRRRES